MKQWLLSALLFAAVAADGLGQSTEKVVQISGIVLVGDSLYPAPYVSIVRERDHRGTYTNNDGYFTMPALAGDTLRFFCIGLEDSFFYIPKETTEYNLSLVQVMGIDTITLPTVYILPYPAPNKIRQELLALDLPGDNYLAFSRGMPGITNYDGMADFSDRAYRQSSSTLINRYTGGFQSGGNLLDQAAWNRFMKAIKSGDMPVRQ